MASNGLTYEFGPFKLDTSAQVLFRDTEMIQLTLKSLNVLVTLVENAGQIISKDELMQRIWPDVFIEEGNVEQHIHILRKALGEQPRDRQFIRTLPRRGYCFVAKIQALERTSLMLTNEPGTDREPSVEECFKELREMFPDRWIQVEVSERLGACVFMIRIYGKPRQGVWLPSLAECMAQVRQWKQEQEKAKNGC